MNAAKLWVIVYTYVVLIKMIGAQNVSDMAARSQDALSKNVN